MTEGYRICVSLLGYCCCFGKNLHICISIYRLSVCSWGTYLLFFFFLLFFLSIFGLGKNLIVNKNLPCGKFVMQTNEIEMRLLCVYRVHFLCDSLPSRRQTHTQRQTLSRQICIISKAKTYIYLVLDCGNICSLNNAWNTKHFTLPTTMCNWVNW